MMPLRKGEERRRRKINFCLMMYVAPFVLEQKEIVLIVVTATTTEFFFSNLVCYCFAYIFSFVGCCFFLSGRKRERERDGKEPTSLGLPQKREVFLLFFSSDAHTPEERRK